MNETQQAELIALRQYKQDMESNPYTTMYEGLRKQWDNLAAELSDETTVISISGDDKAFDRFAKFIEKLGPMTESIEKLRRKIGLEDGDRTEVKKKQNPVELSAKK